MDRQTQTIKTPSGKDVTIKTYLTARENRQVREAYLASVHPEFSADGQQAATKVHPEKLSLAEDRLIEVAVMDFDGSAENTLQRILDGSSEDYEFIVSEANKLRRNFPRAE